MDESHWLSDGLGYAALVAALILVWLIWTLNRVTVKSIAKLLEAERYLEPVAAIDDADFQAAKEPFAQWCTRHGHVHEMYLLSHTLLVATPLKAALWWSEAEKTYACFYYGPQGEGMIEFVTGFGQQDSLSTASGKDALMLPRPAGAWAQAFVGGSPDQLHARHIEACRLLERCGAGTRGATKPETLHLLTETLKRQAQYVMSLPLWRWRGVWWYFGRRHLLADRPIDLRREAS